MGGRSPSGIITLVLIEGPVQLVSDRLIEDFDGQPLVSSAKTETIAVFDRATDGLLFSLQIVRQFRELVRIAVVTHEMDLSQLDDDQWAFVRARAVVKGAFDGMVLVSSGTREVLRGYSEEFGLMMLGRYHLPDVERPETLYRLTHRSIPNTFPRPTRFTEAPNNLPSLGGAFRGRELEMAYLDTLARESRKIVLFGPSGIGKSRLAVAFGQNCMERDFDGVWFIDLHSAVDVDERLERLTADRIGVNPNPDQTPVEQIVDRLRNLNCLLIFDGCEVAKEAVAQLVPRLTAQCQNLMVLMTSQVELNIERVSHFDIPPLSPGPHGDAVDLFVDRVSLSDPEFDPDESEVKRIAEICDRLANMPMAIEVVAAGYHQVDGQIDLDDVPLDGVTEALDWIVEHLTQDELRIAHAAAVFRGPIHAAALTEVAGVTDLTPLNALGRRALLIPDGAGGYHMANAVRDYFAMLDTATHEDLEFEHASWFNEYAQKAGKAFDASGDTAVFGDDIDNFHQALDSVCRRRDAELAFAMVYALFDYWYRTQRYGEGVYWVVRALEVCADPINRARLLNLAASLCLGNADYGQGSRFADDGITLARKAKRYDLLARLFMNSGLLLYGQENYESALAAMKESRRCARLCGEGTAVPDLYSAAILAEMERFPQAEATFGKLPLEELPNVMRPYVPLRRGIMRIFERRWNEAESLLIGALISFHRLQDEGGIRGVTQGLVIVYANIEMYAMSAKFIGLCDALSRTSIGFWPRKQRELYDAAVLKVQENLGRPMLDQLRAEAQETSLDRVVLDLSLSLPPHSG